MPGSGRPPGRARASASLFGDAGARARRIGGSMSKKRVHEIAKEHGLSSKQLLELLAAAGIEAKAAASSVEEADALKVLATDGAAAQSSANGAPAPPSSAAVGLADRPAPAPAAAAQAAAPATPPASAA